MDLIAVLANPALRSLQDELARSAPIPSSGPFKPKVRQKQLRLTKAEQTTLVSAYVDGDTLERLAEVFGVHRTTVIAILERHEVPRRYQKLTTEILRQASALYAQGWSLERVGAALEVDASTVQRRFRKEGITRRSTSGR